MDMHLQGLWRFSFIEYRLEVAAIGGASGFGVGNVHRFLANPFGGFLTGFEADVSYILNGSFHTLTTETSLVLGYEF